MEHHCIPLVSEDLLKLETNDARRYQLGNTLIKRWAAINPDKVHMATRSRKGYPTSLKLRRARWRMSQN